MVTKINHIGIAVSSLEEHIPFYRDVLQLKMTGTDELKDQKVRVVTFRVGDVNLELLEPTTEESPIAQFIKHRGEGLHHIAYETDDIEEGIDGLKKKRVIMIDETPRQGAHGTRIAFLHPKSTCRVLTELMQCCDDDDFH
jgi:methylmalonyl-CoA/ethylmalonyl-CoA epimerase